METKNRQKILLIAAVAVVLLLVGDSLIIEPLIKSFRSRSERIVALKKQEAEGKVMIDRELAIRSHWEDMRTNTLPSNTSLAEAEFLKTFYRCARDSGISIVSFRPQWKQGEEYTTYECAADASGNIDTLSRFLFELEKDPLALKISNVKITTHDDKGQQLTMGLQLSGLMLNSTTQQ